MREGGYIDAKKSINGCHLLENLLKFPLLEYLIFSIFKKYITSVIHCVLEGAVVDFQFRRRWRLAMSEVKATTSNSLVEYRV